MVLGDAQFLSLFFWPCFPRVPKLVRTEDISSSDVKSVKKLPQSSLSIKPEDDFVDPRSKTSQKNE